MKVTFPALPPAAEDVADVIARRIKHSAAAERRRKAEKWIPITVPEFRPFALSG